METLEMATSVAIGALWEEIERSESYLVCCMFEEAASLSSSVLRQLCDKRCAEVEDSELSDLLESGGMVLVQSLKELGRTSDILKELKMLFGSIAAVPVEVFLTGVYFQISEGPSSGVRQFLEEFLCQWRYVDQHYYVLAPSESTEGYAKGCDGQMTLGVDKYLEVVESYVVTLLGRTLGEMDFAVSWVEKATLPEENRQGLLRRLHSLSQSKITTSSTHGSVPSLLADQHQNGFSSLNEPNILGGVAAKGDNNTKEAILKFSGQKKVPCLWWFRSIKLKFGGSHQLVVSNGNVVLGCLMILVGYILRRRRASVQRFVKRQAWAVKKGMVDLWQLAFSYQVNPLAAAVQPLTAPARGGR